MKNNVSDECTDPNSDAVFYFETEHLALRGNPSYTKLLRTIAVLQAQRIKVHQQIDKIEEARKTYLANPQILIKKLINKESLISPDYTDTVHLPQLPKLNQGRFTTDATDDNTKPPFGWSTFLPVHENITEKKIQYNRLWTNEEQRRLEELLIEYPPEEIEMRRFSKIAKALGNRTPQQVFSRVQKYFQKLCDAGMPVPGRIPKHRRPGLSKQKFNMRRSTFFPAQNISLQMPEDDCVENNLQVAVLPSQIKTELKTNVFGNNKTEDQHNHQLKLDILTAIHKEKLDTINGYNPDPLTPKCGECSEATITRVRWRCNSCYSYVNLCADCLTDQIVNNSFEHITHDVVDSEA